MLRRQLERTAMLADSAARADLLPEAEIRASLGAERDRIAREIHDTVAHAVSLMVLQAGAVRTRLDHRHARERAALADSEETGRRAIADLRRMLTMLRSDKSEGLAPQPTIAALADLAEESRRLGLAVELTMNPPAEAGIGGLDPALEVSIYRIVQEALTNVRKHSRASRVRIVLDQQRDRVHLSVVDNGCGTPEPATAPGFGLSGIRERVGVFGGDVEAGPLPRGGYAVEVDLPLAPR